MKERPIIFSAPMVRAILAGKKTQTRRLVKTRYPLSYIGCSDPVEQADPANWGWFFDGPDHHGYMVLGRRLDERHDHGRISIPCPYGEPGDRLWVREGFALAPAVDDPSEDIEDDWHAMYRADDDGRPWLSGSGEDAVDVPAPWRSPIHMPRWVARIVVEIIDVRAQRLQDISNGDAWAEGIEEMDGMIDSAAIARAAKVMGCAIEDARATYGAMWDQINGARRRREYLTIGDPRYTARRPWRTVIDTSAALAATPWVWAVTFSPLEMP